MFCTQNFINLSGRTVVRPYNVWGAWYVRLLLYVCNLSFRCSRCLHEKVTFAQKNIIMENIHVVFGRTMVRPNTIHPTYAMHLTHPAKVLGSIFTITAR